MDGATLTRLRWRLRGAWMWPSFVVLTIVDGVIAQRLPTLGDSESFIAGWLAGLIVSLAAIVFLSPPLGILVRKLRPDMPKLVARDYAGALLCLLVVVVVTAAGIAHHPVVTSDQNALDDATARAEAYIGAHAPSAFQVHLRALDTYEVQPPQIYRSCASNAAGTRYYCVVVNRSKPFGQSVRYDGSESNTLLSQGTN